MNRNRVAIMLCAMLVTALATTAVTAQVRSRDSSFGRRLAAGERTGLMSAGIYGRLPVARAM